MLRTVAILSLLTTGFLVCCSVASARTPTQSADQPIRLRDVNGTSLDPLKKDGRVATVFFFITHDCPICNSYAPQVNRLCADYASDKIVFYLVYVEADLTALDARRHARAHRYRCPALRDPAQTLTRQVQVRVTPESVVLGPDNEVLYRGRIDDRYVDFGKMQEQPRVCDLRLAIDAVLAGKPVVQPRTKAIGCYIPEVSAIGAPPPTSR